MNLVISDIISTQIIPVLLLPVTGLLALVFYNRATAINQRIRITQKELRDLHVQTPSQHSPRLKEMIPVLHTEVHLLHKRSRLIWISLINCLLTIGIFSLCALFVALELFFSWSLHVALVFWFFGPILICVSALCGILELLLSAKTLHIQSALVQKWEKERTQP